MANIVKSAIVSWLKYEVWDLDPRPWTPAPWIRGLASGTLGPWTLDSGAWGLVPGAQDMDGDMDCNQQRDRRMDNGQGHGQGRDIGICRDGDRDRDKVMDRDTDMDRDMDNGRERTRTS